MDNIDKKIGYVLLFAGVLLIAVPLAYTAAIFMGKALPPQVFKTEMVKPAAQQPNNPFDIQQQVQKGLENILPIALINTVLNLVIWVLLMWILMFGGGQIANLGIRLIK